MRQQVHIKQKAFEEIVLRSGLNYKDLAKKIGVSRVYLSNIKNEKCPDFRPSGRVRQALLQELNCKFDDIFVIKQNETDQVAKPKTKKK